MFWLDATSIDIAKQRYTDIGRQCGIAEPSIDNVKSWLAYNEKRWLLIIDNADNPEIDYSELIPPGRGGDILFTTRNPECTIFETVGSETLGGLESNLAWKLLLRTARTAESQWEEKEEPAMAIVKVLESHTLAIIQAGAFIRKKLCTLEEYPAIFQQQKSQLLKFHSQQNMSTYRNVYTTFEVAAEHLGNSKQPDALDALNLLHTLAFMHNTEISEAIFQRASKYASELGDTENSKYEEDDVLSLSVRHVMRLPKYIQNMWSKPQDRLQWRRVCAILESLSIATMHGHDGSITIFVHPLVHTWAKERQDYESQCRSWQCAATILALSCKDWYSFYGLFIFLEPHVRACVSHKIEEYTRNMSDMEAAQIFFQFAYVLYTMRDESSLSSLVQSIRLRLLNKHGTDQEIAVQIKIFTARVSLQQGRFDEGVELLQHVVKVREKLADDHPDRLVSQHELACAYEANRQVAEAVKLLQHVVKVQVKLAEDHPNRLASQHELACAYKANGQVAEAVELLQHVVKVKEKLVKDHPSRLTSQHALAYAYKANGQVAEAVEHVSKKHIRPN